jgi:AbrB family looped-hinge helix DNA binding protein
VKVLKFSYFNLTFGFTIMSKTRLSSKGQVIIPKSSRAAHHWEAGQELVVIDTEEGVLLKPARPVAKSTLEELSGCLRYQGPAKSLEDMERAIKKGANEARENSNG